MSYGICSTVSAMAQTKPVLNLEVSDELKERIMKHAADHGLSQAASVRVLLDAKLTELGYPRKAR